uniref:FERM adjacent domain-containing protein n=1 Tax=Sphaeramia orbicularis TaxID=375764 RepID=A0A673C9G3_9TELE
INLDPHSCCPPLFSFLSFLVQKKLVLTFHTSTPAACKHLWKCGVENQAFYKCAKSSQIKTVSSSNIFFKGSRFRYSGRVAKEVIEARQVLSIHPTDYLQSNHLLCSILYCNLHMSYSPGAVAVKDSASLSPLKPSATSTDTEQQHTEGSTLGNDLQPPRVPMETSNLRPQMPKAEDEADEDDESSGALTISELVYSLRLLSSNERVNACLLSVARLVAVVMGVLIVTVPTLLLLLESDIDVSFLHEIRQTPEFEQFHYEYYCPLRRWILCKISMAMENLWSD